MAIATITPQNRVQTNLLAQALNGSSGSLAQALNSAIQKSTLDLQIQAQQGQTLVREQSRNLQLEQEERFDLRNRAERAFDMSERKKSNEIINDGRQQDLATKQFRLGNEQRDRLQDVEQGTTPSDLRRIQMEERESTAADRKRVVEADISKSEASKRASNILADSREEDRTNRREDRNKAEAEQLSNDEIQQRADEEVETSLRLLEAGQLGLDKANPDELISAINVIDKSSLANDPRVIRMRGEIKSLLPDDSGDGDLLPRKPLTGSQTTQLIKAQNEIRNVSELQKDETNEDKLKELRLRMQDAQATLDGLDPDGYHQKRTKSRGESWRDAAKGR